MAYVIAPRGERTQPVRIVPGYPQTPWRNPRQPLVKRPLTLSELTGPVYGDSRLSEIDADLTRQHAGAPLGERITVSGRGLGADGRPLRGQLVEIGGGEDDGRPVVSTLQQL